MSEIKNRELSQFSSFLHIDNINQNIGIASDTTPFIGIGTVNPSTKLHVVGNITANDIYADNAVFSGITTFNATSSNITILTGTNINYTGISTFGSVQISSGIVTATSGIVTYYGDGSKLIGTISGIGINTASGNVGFGATVIDFRGVGISTVTVSSGIATVNVIGQLPSGLNGYVQYYSNGSFQGSPNLTFNSNDLNVAGVVTAVNFYGSLIGTADLALGLTGTPNITVGIVTANRLVTDTISATGIITAPTFSGNATTATLATNAQGLTGTPNITVGFVTAVSLNIGIVTTNILYVNEINAPGIAVTMGNVIAGVVTATDLFLNNIFATGIVTATDFNSTSDIHLKENIHTIQNALEIISNLRGVSFDWKNNHQSSYGVIAQELENVLPELVTDSDPKTVNYNGLIGVLIQGMKELMIEIEELKKYK
jgi:hypothetical protein